MKKKLLALGIISASVLLSACDSDDGEKTIQEETKSELCSETTLSFVACNDVDGAEQWVLSGTITEDFTLTADKEWILDGVVLVGQGNVEIADNAQAQAIKDAGVTLTVEAGTNIVGVENSVLIVTRGSKIMAEGTATAPITFSSADNNFDGEGEWGGVIIQGFAAHYGAGNTGVCSVEGNTFCNVTGEGVSEVGNFGGTDDADNSGVFKYVRIAEGGLVPTQDSEVNGLTLMGVGHGTTIEYVHVHGNLDDGIEWFGGTVNVK